METINIVVVHVRMCKSVKAAKMMIMCCMFVMYEFKNLCKRRDGGVLLYVSKNLENVEI